MSERPRPPSGAGSFAFPPPPFPLPPPPASRQRRDSVAAASHPRVGWLPALMACSPANPKAGWAPANLPPSGSPPNSPKLPQTSGVGDGLQLLLYVLAWWAGLFIILALLVILTSWAEDSERRDSDWDELPQSWKSWKSRARPPEDHE